MIKTIGNALEAVFQTQPSPKVSGRYQFYPTSKVIEVMENEGFEVSRMQGLSSRSKHPEYGKHLITFRKQGQQAINSDGVPEFIFVNSHNRTSAAKWMHGYFRWACENGCIFGQFDSVSSVTHTSNNPMTDLINMIRKGVAESEERMECVVKMQQIVLDSVELEEYVEDVARIRDLDDPYQLMYAHRRQDRDPTLWMAYNRAQESLIRGKYDTFNRETGKYRKARPINSISETIRINTELWLRTEAWADSLTF